MSSSRLPSVVTLLAGLIVVAACGNPTSPAAAIDIRPAALSFARVPRGMAEVPFTVTHTGRTAVLLTSRCGDRLTPAIEQRTATGWEPYAGGFCPAIHDASPVALAAGGRREDVAFVANAGDYRLILGTEHGAIASIAFTVR